MTREQLISLLATLGSVVLFRLVTRFFPPKTLAQRERERLALEALEEHRAED
jgi:hypothetical protein